MSSTAQAPKGKAWWVQLQHDRAVSAGCQFYTYRPATSGHSAYLQQDPGFDEQAAKLRPFTSDASMFSTRTTSSSMCSPHNLCLMRPSTSAKLPARKALGSRQGDRTCPISTAVSRPVPMSRGNDWSPVHSRPVTSSNDLVARRTAPPADTSTLATGAEATTLTVMPAGKLTSRPPLAPNKKQGTCRSSGLLHQPSSLVNSQHILAAVLKTSLWHLSTLLPGGCLITSDAHKLHLISYAGSLICFPSMHSCASDSFKRDIA